MAKKAQEGGVNKSQAIRELLKENPEIKAGEAIATLGKKGITVKNIWSGICLFEACGD